MKKNDDNSLMDRRRFLKIGMGVGAGGLLSTPIIAQVADACLITPDQVKGPFYPAEDRPDENTDLTKVNGRTELATGQIHYIDGQVVDESCAPVAGALVEIWQACHTGRYDHENDAENPAELDPNFQYWGETRTDSEGKFEFKTIKPGSYPADVNWDRPPHIHYKVSKRGYREVITQMYFKGEPLNDRDHILQGLSPEEQDIVVVDFQDSAPPRETTSKSGTFTVSLKKVTRR